jgi:hypothetical protein
MGGEDDETCTHTLNIVKILLILHLHIPNPSKRRLGSSVLYSSKITEENSLE